MKKILGVLIFSVVFTMCKNNHQAIEESNLKNDSLQHLINQKDSSMYTFINTLSLIESNLQTIKEKEGIINTTALDDTEHYKTREEKINDDIEFIYNLMNENKDAIEHLEKQLKNAKTNERNLRTIISTLNQKILAKDAEILELQNKLKQMNIQLAKLSYKIDTLDLQNRMNKDIIELQGQTLKTAYYTMGSSKELKNLEIIKGSGIFSKAQITPDFVKEHFTQINILKDTLFEIKSKKIDILSIHPADSYIIENSEPYNTLIIKEPWDFWSVSKYMVIVIR